MLDVGEDKAELLDCATCERPEGHCLTCPIDFQPERLHEASFWLKLYSRTARWETLPRAGGLLEQDELTMRRLDMIDAVYSGRKKKGGGGEQQRET